MCGPIFASLVRRAASLDLATQQVALEAAGDTIKSFQVSDYYSGSWIVISTMTLSGDLERAARLVHSMRGVPPTSRCDAPSPPPPFPLPLPTPAPTPAQASTPAPAPAPTPVPEPPVSLDGAVRARRDAGVAAASLAFAMSIVYITA
mmetsp:Transcript_11163/g.27959  ORF Transcript_11163/g.27959 Transcript_11163/m.27959 type:complete len:147 (+) Transcript_11163:76-516(+)